MSTGPINKDWVGRVVDGKFPLLEWLGGWERRGVFRTEVQERGRQRQAAIKLVPTSYVGAQTYVARWRAARDLSHPHLMRLLHSGPSQLDMTPLVYSVTEYADELLSDVIPGRALGTDEVREMLVPVIDALSYLHSKGFVHGHLKSSNIMAVGNQLKLSVDHLEMDGELWRESRRLTIYDAPEISVKEMTPAVDVWSLGMTLVEALTQCLPEWDRESGKDPVLPGKMPEPFARIARECLRVDPAKRCTLADVSKGRMEGTQSAGAAQERGLMPAKKAVPRLSRRAETEDEEKPRSIRMGVIAGAAVVVVLLAIFAVMRMGSHSAPATSANAADTASGAAKAVNGKARHATREKRSRAIAKPQPGVPEGGAARTDTTESAGSGAVAERVMPEASQGALRTIQGTVRVTVRVTVDAAGNVTDAAFAKAGPSKYFANAALAAARKWVFQPGSAGTETIVFDFRQSGVDARVE